MSQLFQFKTFNLFLWLLTPPPRPFLYRVSCSRTISSARMCSERGQLSGADITEVDNNLCTFCYVRSRPYPSIITVKTTDQNATNQIYSFSCLPPRSLTMFMLLLHFHLLPRIQNSNIKISFTGKLQYLRKYIYVGERGVTRLPVKL